MVVVQWRIIELVCTSFKHVLISVNSDITGQRFSTHNVPEIVCHSTPQAS